MYLLLKAVQWFTICGTAFNDRYMMFFICRFGVTGIVIQRRKQMAFPVLYSCLFLKRQRFDQSFGSYQDYEGNFNDFYIVTKLHKCPMVTQPCDRNSGERGPACFAVACRRRFLLLPRSRDGDGQRCRASYVFPRHRSIIHVEVPWSTIHGV